MQTNNNNVEKMSFLLMIYTQEGPLEGSTGLSMINLTKKYVRI